MAFLLLFKLDELRLVTSGNNITKGIESRLKTCLFMDSGVIRGAPFDFQGGMEVGVR